MVIQSVAAIIFNEAGKILVVSRKYDLNDFGLPGGKVDSGETLSYAVAREVIEETGLKVVSAKPVYANNCSYNNKEYVTTTFLVDRWKGMVQTQEQGIVTWVDFEKICQIEHSCFAVYNKLLYNYLKENHLIR